MKINPKQSNVAQLIAESGTRVWHKEMRAKDPIPLDAKYAVGGEWLDAPGDPSGSAWNIIQCRCESVHEQVEFV